MNWGFNLAKKFPRSHFQFSWFTATHFLWYNLWEFDVKSNNTCSHLFYISIFSLLCSAWQCIVTVWRRNLLITLGNEKVIDLFLFLVPKQSTLNQKHWKESLVFPLSFISYKSLTCNCLIYLPYNSIKIGHFQYIKIQTWLWGSGG